MKLIKCSPEAREKCPFDHPCDSEEKAYFEDGSPCDAFNKKLIPPPPPTNADHIRSMTDEELAEFLRWDICSKVRGDNRMCNGWCDECVIDWLKQPYKSEETDKKEKEEL